MEQLVFPIVFLFVVIYFIWFTSQDMYRNDKRYIELYVKVSDLSHTVYLLAEKNKDLRNDLDRAIGHLNSKLKKINEN